MRVMIWFLVQGRVRIKIRIRVTVRVRDGGMLNVSIYHRSKCCTFHTSYILHVAHRKCCQMARVSLQCK